ncbi:flagellar hook assembly protein FlgD [Deferrisoma palaeochoriense]
MDVRAIAQQIPDSQKNVEGSKNVTIADFQDFLKLFVSQLKYQDPLSPTGGEEFLAQTAQFSTVEQLVNLNKRAETAVKSTELLQRATVAGYLGRVVTVRTEEQDGTVSGRVVSVTFGNAEEVLLGLDSGYTVPLTDVVDVVDELVSGEQVVTGYGSEGDEMEAQTLTEDDNHLSAEQEV